MKLRYFYLLCFLVCIDWSFCYEFNNIPNDKISHQHGPSKKNSKAKHGSKRNHHKRCRRQGYEDEKDPVASIDIASFIQQPDHVYEAVDDFNPYGDQKEYGQSKDGYDHASLYELQQSFNELKDKLSNNYEDLSNVDSRNSPDMDNTLLGHIYADNFLDTNPSSKNSKRRQAIPFFSHDGKEKKQKKRRFFPFRSKTTSMTTLLPKFNGPKPGMKNSSINIVKRSNLDRFCPVCKRKISQNKVKNLAKAQRKPIHNSRQYFQRLAGSQSKLKKDINSNSYTRMQTSPVGDLINNDMNSEREKRGYDERRQEFEAKDQQAKIYDKTRQLKELEEVQRKVESVDTNYASNTRTPVD